VENLVEISGVRRFFLDNSARRAVCTKMVRTAARFIVISAGQILT